MIQKEAYLRAAYPLPLRPPDQHLSDEDIAALLDKHEQRSRVARKGIETRRRRAMSRTTAPTKRSEE